MRGKLIIAVAVVCAALSTQSTTGDTAVCLACSQARHAPCLVDLQEGSIEELRIYDSREGEDGTRVLLEQRPQTLITFQHGAMCTASIRDGGGRLETSIVSAYDRDESEMRRVFCARCRAALLALSDANGGTRWVLADLYTPRAPRYYPLRAGTLQIRDYTLMVAASTEADAIDLTILLERRRC